MLTSAVNVHTCFCISDHPFFHGSLHGSSYEFSPSCFISPPSSPVVLLISPQARADLTVVCSSFLFHILLFLSMTGSSSHTAMRMSHTARCTPMIEVCCFPQQLNKKAAACKIFRPEAGDRSSPLQRHR